MSIVDDINNLSFKNIGTWPLPIKIGSMVLLLTLIVLAGYWFVWKDQLETLDQEKQKEQKLRAEFLDKKQQAVNLDVYRQQVVEIEQAFGTLLRQLPNKSEMDALLIDINQAGLGRGLEFELFKPGQETQKDFYAQLPITIKVTGSYHDLGRFASDTAQLPRIVTLNNISIAQAQAGGHLVMDAIATTYRYLDEEEVLKNRKAAADKSKKGGK